MCMELSACPSHKRKHSKPGRAKPGSYNKLGALAQPSTAVPGAGSKCMSDMHIGYAY